MSNKMSTDVRNALLRNFQVKLRVFEVYSKTDLSSEEEGEALVRVSRLGPVA